MMSPTATRRVVGPGARIEFLLVAEHAIDLGHRREQLRLDLRRAAGDDDARVRPFALEAADALPRLAHGFRRHRAGVHHHRVVEAGRAARADHFRLGDVEPAAEGDDVDAHATPALANSAGSNVPANSNSTGPVIST